AGGGVARELSAPGGAGGGCRARVGREALSLGRRRTDSGAPARGAARRRGELLCGGAAGGPGGGGGGPGAVRSAPHGGQCLAAVPRLVCGRLLPAKRGASGQRTEWTADRHPFGARRQLGGTSTVGVFLVSSRSASARQRSLSRLPLCGPHRR